MHIRTVSIASQRWEKQKTFYCDTLEFPMIRETDRSFTIRAGASELTFMKRDTVGRPCYHFAFNIREHKFKQAKAWLKRRVSLNDVDGSDEMYGAAWNAHSIYFDDEDGNIVEFIARHTLPVHRDSKPFSINDVENISEIGWPVRDVSKTCERLHQVLGIHPYHQGSEDFQPMGDEHGLFIVVKIGRIWLASDRKGDIYPMKIELEGKQTRERKWQGRGISRGFLRLRKRIQMRPKWGAFCMRSAAIEKGA